MDQPSATNALALDDHADQLLELATTRGWKVETLDHNYSIISAPGLWHHYKLIISCHPTAAIVQLHCEFDIRAGAAHVAAVHETLRKINHRIALGHFVFDESKNVVAFRYSISLNTCNDTQLPATMREISELATAACDTCYPAIRIAASKTGDANAAVDAALLPTVGSA